MKALIQQQTFPQESGLDVNLKINYLQTLILRCLMQAREQHSLSALQDATRETCQNLSVERLG